MKRLLVILIFVLSSVLFLSPVLAEESVILPEEIRDFFSAPSFDGMTVMSRTNGIEIGGTDACYFVLIRTAKNENVLYLFNINKYNGTSWEYTYSTSSAVPQTNHTLEVRISYTGYEWPTGDYFNTPRLSILQYDVSDEYPELCINFELSKGKWLLLRIWSYTEYDSMRIREGSISYYRDIESDQIAGTAKGTFQRDLRYVSLSAIPKTLSEAKAKLTVAPDLPSSDELQVYPVTFSGNNKYDVYSAPDKTSVRGANGKAKVSTNSWIQVFGTEGDWVLIQYSIDASHYRFGYISSKALPKKASVPALSFNPADAWTTSTVSLTDDPLYSNTPLLPLTEGLHVTWLASLGEWAYVEADENDTARGFVPVTAITTSRIFDLHNQPDDNGKPVYEGAIIITHDDRLEAELHIASDGPLAGHAVRHIQIFDTFSGSLLALLSADSYETYYGNCILDGNVTSVTLTAIDEYGSAYPASIRVEW